MFSNFLFMIEILVAELLMTLRLKRNGAYRLRMLLVATALIGVSLLIPTVDTAWYSCLIYLGMFALSVIGLKIIYNEPWINVVFCGVAAYTAQHLAYQFTNLVFTLVLWGESPLFDMYHIAEIDVTTLSWETVFWGALYVMGYFTVYMAVWFLFAKKLNKNEDLKIKNRSLVFLIGGSLILNIVLNSLVVFSGETQTIVTSIVLQISGSFNCLLLLQWQFELVRSRRLEVELNFTEKLLAQAQEQYAFSKENIDLINLKCHDMKHQIREIGSVKQLDAETITDLERSISVYDSVVKTENEALDVILTEKSFKCLRHDIILNCIADGKTLDFMKNSDVYSLFGNALDNAIEAVMKLEDKARRVIGLKVYSVGGLVTINVKNFFDGDITFNADGLPGTTKKDKGLHGYGMKSISMIVEKYGGDLSLQAKNGVFNLNILLPVK